MSSSEVMTVIETDVPSGGEALRKSGCVVYLPDSPITH
jgi:hypothetical protein